MMAALPLWPASLPCRFAAGITLTPQDNAIRFQPEIGDEKVRRRSTQKLVDYAGSVILRSVDDVRNFTSFYEVDLSDGTLPFRYNDVTTGMLATFRFTEPPSWTETSPYKWEVKCTFRRIG